MLKKTVYFLIDTSGSMRNDSNAYNRADAVNRAMSEVASEVVPKIIEKKDATLELSMCVITFGDTKVDWYVPKQIVEEFIEWQPIDNNNFNGGTPTGRAITEVIKDIDTGCYGDNDPSAIPPAIILISDGEPNFDPSDPKAVTYDEALKAADKNSATYCVNFAHANRIAIGIQVADTGRNSLKAFGHITKSITALGLQAYYDCTDDTADALVEIIKSVTFGASIG